MIVNSPNTNPLLHNSVIYSLQQTLDLQVAWLERIYPLAEVGERLDKERVIRYPRVYTGTGLEYVSLFPSDATEAYCFFEIPSGQYTLDNIASEDEMILELSLTVWANLKLLDDSKAWDFRDELIRDITNALRNSEYLEFLEIQDVILDRERIFEDYSFEFKDLKYIMYPYTAFKVVFQVRVDSDLECDVTIPDLLQRYDFCDEAIQNRLTDEQVACLINWLCGCANATVNINGVLFDTVGAGATIDVPVLNTAATPIGTIAPGVSVTIPVSLITVNASAYGSTPATVTGNVDVENTVGTNVGSLSGGKWIIPDTAVTQSDGSSTSSPATVAVVCTRHVTADFSATPLTIEAGDTVAFTDASSPAISSWLWLFGDGGESTSQNPTKQYLAPGSYSPALIATNANDNSAEHKSAYIIVNAYQAQASTLFTRMAAVGAEPNNSYKAIYNRFIKALVDGSQWSLFDRAVVYGVHSQLAIMNWVNTSFTPTLVNSPTFTADRGITGNATSQYINTNYNTSTQAVQYTQNNCSWGGVMLLDRIGLEQLGGALALGSAGNAMQPRISGNLATSRTQSNNGTSASVTNSIGLLSGKRTDSANHTLWKNGVQIDTRAHVSTALVNRNNLELANDSNGTIVQFSGNEIFFGYHGSGAIDQPILYAALQQLAADLGLAI